MEEIKAPLHKRIWYFIWEHITLIGIIFFFAVVLFSSCGKAKAMELPCTFDEAWGFVKEQIGNSYDAQMNDVYYYLSHGTVYDVCYMSNSQYDVYIISETNHLIIPCADNSNTPTIQFSTYRYDLMTYYSNGFNSSVNTFVAIILDKNNNNAWGCYYGTGTNSSGSYRETLYSLSDNNSLINGVSNTMFYWGTSLFSDIRSNGFRGSNFSLENVYSHGNIGFSRQSMTYAFVTKNNWEELFPSAVEDDRLEIYKTVSVSGTDNLNIDLSKFRTGYSAAVSKTFSDVTVTVNYDGTEQQFVLNDTNSQIVDSFNPTNEAYVVITPYSFFDIDTYQDVYISEVDFSLTTSSAGGSGTEDFHILCEYYLKRTNVRPEEEDIPKDTDVEGTKLTTVEYDKIKDKVNFSDGYYSPLGGGGTELVVPDGYNVLYVTITGSRTIASIINEIIENDYIEVLLPDGSIMDAARLAVYLAGEIKSSITGITSTADAEALIKDMVKNNYYTNMFDIVVYYWAPDSSLGEVDVMYYYLTESGRLRGISQTLADVYKEVNQVSVNTKATYEFLYDKLNDFETMTLEAIWGDSPFSIFTNLDKLDNDMLSSVSRIIESMPTGYYDGGILDKLDNLASTLFEKLDTIIGNQNSTKDGYPQYIAWVKDSINNSGLHKWANGVIDSLKKAFTFLVPSDLDSEVDGDQTYIWYSNEFFDYVFGDERLTSYLPNDTINIYSYTGGYTYE